MEDALRWMMFGPFAAVILALGWAHSIMAVIVLLKNKIAITKRIVVFAAFPYGMIMFAWFTLAHHLGVWLRSSDGEDDDAPFDEKVNWGAILGL